MILVLMTAMALQDSERILREAFEKSSKVDGVGLQGSVKKPDVDGAPGGGPGMMMMGGGSLEGDLAGKLSDKDAVLTIENKDKGTSMEIFKKSDKTAKRATWIKEPVGAGPAVEMLVKLTSFDALAHAARDGKFEEAVEETSDGKTVLRIRGTMPEKLLEFEEERGERNGPPMRLMFGKVKKITLDARVEKETGVVHSLAFTIERELDMGGMQVRRFGQGGDEDIEPAEMPKIQIKQSVEFKVSGTGDEHKPKFPENIEKILQ